MRCIQLFASAFLLLLASQLWAAPTGFYGMIAGGWGFVDNGRLDTLEEINGPDQAVYIYPQRQGASQVSGQLAIGDFFQLANLHRALGFELGYHYFPDLTSHAVGNANNVHVSVTQRTKTWAGDASFIASLDLLDSLSLLAKTGIGYAEIRRHTTVDDGITGSLLAAQATENDKGLGWTLGLGLRFKISDHFALRIEGDSLIGRGNLSYLQGLLGLVFGVNA